MNYHTFTFEWYRYIHYCAEQSLHSSRCIIHSAYVYVPTLYIYSAVRLFSIPFAWFLSVCVLDWELRLLSVHNNGLIHPVENGKQKRKKIFMYMYMEYEMEQQSRNALNSQEKVLFENVRKMRLKNSFWRDMKLHIGCTKLLDGFRFCRQIMCRKKIKST